MYEGVPKSFLIGRLERQLQMVELSATMYSCNAVLGVSLVSFAATILRVTSQRIFIVVIVVDDFVIDSARKLLVMPSYDARCVDGMTMLQWILTNYGLYWTRVAQGSVQWRALVNAVMNIRGPNKGGITDYMNYYQLPKYCSIKLFHYLQETV